MRLLKMRYLCGVMAVAMLARCGVPPEAGELASSERALAATTAADDAAVRARLVAQEAAWTKLSMLVQERVIGGTSVDEGFVQAVKEIAALAKRQRELIEGGKDDAAFDRQALERFEGLWSAAEKYLK